MEWMLLAFVGGMVGLYYYRDSLLTPVVIEQDADALYQTWAEIPYSIGQPTGEGHWNRAILVISEREVRLQTKQEKGVRFNAMRDELRGYYQIENTVYLHAHIGTSWYILQLRSLDNKLVTSLNYITDEGLPNKLEPTYAHFNDAEVILYLAPFHLVISTGGLVQYTIERNTISNVNAADDTLTFESDGRTWVFTVSDAKDWAQDLSKRQGTR